MKAITNRMLLTFVGVALVAPFFAIALIVGARAVALSQGMQDDLLLMALAFGGAALSIINGLGRRMNQTKGSQQAQTEAGPRAKAHDASAIGLGY